MSDNENRAPLPEGVVEFTPGRKLEVLWEKYQTEYGAGHLYCTACGSAAMRLVTAHDHGPHHVECMNCRDWLRAVNWTQEEKD